MLADLHLGYIGGSGGFLAFHLLMLSNKYVNCLNKDFETIVQKQWNIKDHKKWKLNEVWPDNTKTSKLDGSPKLYFYCNPSVDEWQHLPGDRLLVYTDLESQLKLSEYKNCWIYHSSTDNRDLDLQFSLFYQNIKDPQWPQCTTIQDSTQLPDWIRSELMQSEYYQQFIAARSWEDWIVKYNHKSVIDHKVVFHPVVELANHSNFVIKLQDIVNTDGHALLDALDIEVTDPHRSLLACWRKLHSADLLVQIGIDCQTS